MERKNQNSELLNTQNEEKSELSHIKNLSSARLQHRSGGDMANEIDLPLEGNEDELSQQNSYLSIENQDDLNIYDDDETRLDENVENYCEMGSKLKAELSRYKKELREYNTTTKDLEEKYRKINNELSEMQQKHDIFVSKRKAFVKGNKPYTIVSTTSASSCIDSDYSLQRKYTQVFKNDSNCENSYDMSEPNTNDDLIKSQTSIQMTNPHINVYSGLCHDLNKTIKHQFSKRKPSVVNKENVPPYEGEREREKHKYSSQQNNIKDIYNALRNVLQHNNNNNNSNNNNTKTQKTQKHVYNTNNSKDLGNINSDMLRGLDIRKVQAMMTHLQKEQQKSRSIITQQQKSLHDYHKRCVKAQHVMETQQDEIEKLTTNNAQMEEVFSKGIDKLRVKIEAKLREVSHFPEIIRSEQLKNEKVMRENKSLSERLRNLQKEAADLKNKLEEISHRKTTTLNRLRIAEKDLKIFKNHNMALRNEKRRLVEELSKVRQQLESTQSNNKRTLSRARENFEKQRRDLQKRIFELELKLRRSQNSTSGIIQARDNLIAELQAQLNTLVHNFEVSQKHIRVLRRHIYSMANGNNINAPSSPNNILGTNVTVGGRMLSSSV